MLPAMATDFFTLEHGANGVAHLQLCRPERMNTFEPPFFPAVRDTVEALNAEGRTRVLVISSTGKHFSAGMALDTTEGQRVAQLLGPGKSVLFMGNHGVIVVAPSVAQAFDELYYLEKAAQLQLLALSTGRPLALIPDAVAALACAQWNDYPTQFSELHFRQLQQILDQDEPDYKT